MSLGDGASVAGRLWRQRGPRAALLGLALLAGVAGVADCLASDLPLLVRHQGVLHVLPNLTRPAALRRHDNHSLRRTRGRGDWAVEPLIPYGPAQTQPDGALLPSAAPSGGHWLGTDEVGRDVAAQLVHGCRVALLVGAVAVLLGGLAGLLLGLLAGFLRGWVDTLITWAAGAVLTFPAFLLVLAVQGLVGAQSVTGIVLILAATGWAGIARLVRAEVLRLAAEPFIEAARGLGGSTPRLLAVHVLPHVAGPVLVAATFAAGAAILTESALSFLGLGPDAPSWGRLLAQAQLQRSAWWLTVFPGLAIFGTVLASNHVAEGLQSALDPRAPLPPGRGPRPAAPSAVEE